ncbi:MAG: EamA family transporter [Alphaproteobacteria bacterium]
MPPHLSSVFCRQRRLLALAIVFVWGTNFVVIRLGLNALPPLFFATLRFLFVFVPAALFLPRPKIGWANLAIHGVAIGLFQFGILFIAIHGRISPGLASLCGADAGVLHDRTFRCCAPANASSHTSLRPSPWR